MSTASRIVASVIVCLPLVAGCDKSKQAEVASSLAGKPGPAPAGAAPAPPGWTMDLKAMNPPDSPVSGKLGGHPFKPEKIEFDGDTLTFRSGKDFFADQEIKLLLFGAGELGEGSKVDVEPAQEFGKPSPHIHAAWKVAGKQLPETSMFMGKYALKLEFGKAAGGKLPCKIYLSLPDAAKSFLAGTFSLDGAAMSGAKVHGNIAIKGDQKRAYKLSVGLIGQTAQGKQKSGFAGFTIAPGDSGSVSSFATELKAGENGDITFRHGRIPPGSYLVFVAWDDKSIEWRWIDVTNEAEIRVDLAVDPAAVGELEVTIPASAKDRRVHLLPLDGTGQLPKAAGSATSLAIQLGNYFKGSHIEAAAGQNSVKFTAIRAGKYRAIAGDMTADVEVAVGKPAKTTLK